MGAPGVEAADLTQPGGNGFVGAMILLILFAASCTSSQTAKKVWTTPVPVEPSSSIPSALTQLAHADPLRPAEAPHLLAFPHHR